MPSDDEERRPSHRKLHKSLRARPGRSDRITQSLNLPSRSRSRDAGDDEPDASLPSEGIPYNMSQSIFQLMSARKGKLQMSSRFEEDDEDDDSSSELGETPVGKEDKGKGIAGWPVERGSANPSLNRLHPIEEAGHTDESADEDSFSDSKSSAGPAPYMSQILEAQAHINTSQFQDNALRNEQAMFSSGELDQPDRTVDLAEKLMDIFCLPAKEEVITEYPCWLLKSVLLQGYLYITTKHICFFAYLPKKLDATTKSGYLTKRGKSNLKFTRYWFILKGDVLQYHINPSEQFFVQGHIDLRYGISANLSDPRDGKEPTTFTVTTNERSVFFRADSATSAKEWVKALQKVIFRSHNDGDSVKISIPVANVIEVEESHVLEFADTVKIKVYPNDDTYALDEYFFSFFSFGQDAISVLRNITDGSTARNAQDISGYSTPSGKSQDFTTATNSLLQEGVRATLSPTGSVRGSPRPSGEFHRSSLDASRPTPDKGPWSRPLEPQRHSLDARRPADNHKNHRRIFSADSTDHSFAESYDNVSSDGDGTQSASNILSRSDVFRAPTMGHSQSLNEGKSPRRSLSKRQKQKDPAVSKIFIHPPTRRHTADSNHGESHHQSEENGNGSAQTLQEIAKAGSYPLQRAVGWAGWMKKRSKKMGTLIASQPMGYLEKVSDMWTGGRKHFREPMGMMPQEKIDDAEGEGESIHEREERFRMRFALAETEQLTAVYFGYLHRVLPIYGKIYLGTRTFCFRSIIPGTKTKMVLPLKAIENIDKEKGFRFGYSGLVLTIRGHEELFFEFGQVDTRDDCALTLLQSINDVRLATETGVLTEEAKHEAEAAKLEHETLQAARAETQDSHNLKMVTDVTCSEVSEAPTIVFDDTHGSVLNFRPTESLKITCLTIGSRGDVQPYIALCLGLMKDGHKTKIATHAEFREWVESFGIEFAPVAGDPAELMQLCVEYGMFTVEFIKQTSSRMRGWLDGLLESSKVACEGSDILIESPSAMGGIHIAESLGIPYFRAFTMPWTRTRAYPHAFAVPEHKMGGAYNYFTYVIIDNVFWKSTAGQINRWRKRSLGLPPTSLDKLQPNKVPFLYNFSPYVVAPPVDYSDWIHVTGYWFLDTKEDWEPPQDLLAFMKKARDDGKKIVYIGFGSVTVGDPEAMTRVVVDSVLKADVRCILSKGWSDRLAKKDVGEPEFPLPEEIHQVKSCPHDWLFRQIDVACHHGGAGTTGASLRAGIPTIIKPFFGDQFFFGNRVEDLGVGICVRKMNTTLFSKALRTATHDTRMIVKAEVLGEQIRRENGVNTAIQMIYRELDYARTLVRKRGDIGASEPADDSEESWTVIGDENDLDKASRRASVAASASTDPVPA